MRTMVLASLIIACFSHLAAAETNDILKFAFPDDHVGMSIDGNAHIRTGKGWNLGPDRLKISSYECYSTQDKKTSICLKTKGKVIQFATYATPSSSKASKQIVRYIGMADGKVDFVAHCTGDQGYEDFMDSQDASLQCIAVDRSMCEKIRTAQTEDENKNLVSLLMAFTQKQKSKILSMIYSEPDKSVEDTVKIPNGALRELPEKDLYPLNLTALKNICKGLQNDKLRAPPPTNLPTPAST